MKICVRNHLSNGGLIRPNNKQIKLIEHLNIKERNTQYFKLGDCSEKWVCNTDKQIDGRKSHNVWTFLLRLQVFWWNSNGSFYCTTILHLSEKNHWSLKTINISKIDLSLQFIASFTWRDMGWVTFSLITSVNNMLKWK